MEEGLLKLALEHGSAVAFALVACVYLARQLRAKDTIIAKKDDEMRVLIDRYVSKFERLSELQQETLRMQTQATLAVREAAQAVSGLRQELEGDQ